VKRIAVLASGRGSNLRAIHAATRSGALEGVAEIVVVGSDKPSAQALVFAGENGIPTITLAREGRSREAWDEELLRLLEPHAPDVVVLAGFMRVLSGTFVAAYRGRIVNIHPADTRAHQGLGGYAFAFERHLDETTITVHLVDEGLDTGAILAQRAVDLRGVTSLHDVEERGLAVEHALYPEALRALLNGLSTRS
jgi:phosphoribosylglycinamide formyltransferase-1